MAVSPFAEPAQAGSAAAVSRVAAVIPAWNEAEALGPLLAELRELDPGVVDDVLVVLAQSTDATAAVARAAGARVVAQARPGYGAACWEGYQAARAAGATLVVFLDGDGSDPPNAIPQLLAPLARGQADLVLGVRRAEPGRSRAAGAIPWHARAGNALVCRLLWWRSGRLVSDLPSMKALGVDRLADLELTEMGYGWTTEMIAKALTRGWRVHEVAVRSRPRFGGRSKVSGNVRASVRAAYALVTTALRASRRPA
jgi:glycosyltransferase involved in cell wall biosynthesis